MSQSPTEAAEISADHPYAQAANRLNRLVRMGKSFSGHERNCCFLNLHNQRFADLSAVSGLAFDDDGRAVASLDIDFDGDVDFWIANRTGPQIRLLRNETSSGNHFIALRLQGTDSNRDGIGSIIRLYLKGHETPLIRGVRAGEGFLAQSSKWVHFGLGESTSIEKIEIMWPGGDTQELTGADVDRFYVAVEGAEALQLWEPPPTAEVRQAEPLLADDFSGVTHRLLDLPMSLPPLWYESLSGERRDATRVGGKPRLINLWASWCRPCLAELKDLTQRESDLTASGLEVLALSVDAVDSKSTRADATRVLQAISFPHEASWATGEFLEAMQLVNNIVFRDDHRSLPVPTSFLVDDRGRLAAIYKGPVTVERILADVQRIRGDSEPFATLPFAGRWLGLPGPYRFARLADQLWNAGLKDSAVGLAMRLPIAIGNDQRATEQKLATLRIVGAQLKHDGRLSDAAKLWQDLLSEQPKLGEGQLELGVLQATQGKFDAAISHFQQAAKLYDEPNSSVHLNLAQAYGQVGKPQLAHEQFQRALEIDPDSVVAISGLALSFAARGELPAAVDWFAKAIELEPNNMQHRLNQSFAYLRIDQAEEALAVLDEGLQKVPDSVEAQVYAAEALKALRRPQAAIERLKRAAELAPNAAEIWFQLGSLSQQVANYGDAITYFEKVNLLVSSDPNVMSRLAWLLSTAPDDAHRDGKRAVKLAERAVELTERRDPQILDRLAAAYAEQDRFKEAVRAASDAIEILVKQKKSQASKEIDQRKIGYEAKTPFRLPTSKSAR